jgi:hypothetical protein
MDECVDGEEEEYDIYGFGSSELDENRTGRD